MMSETFALKMAKAKAIIWPSLAYLFQVRSTTGEVRVGSLSGCLEQGSGLTVDG